MIQIWIFITPKLRDIKNVDKFRYLDEIFDYYQLFMKFFYPSFFLFALVCNSYCITASFEYIARSSVNKKVISRNYKGGFSIGGSSLYETVVDGSSYGNSDVHFYYKKDGGANMRVHRFSGRGLSLRSNSGTSQSDGTGLFGLKLGNTNSDSKYKYYFPSSTNYYIDYVFPNDAGNEIRLAVKYKDDEFWYVSNNIISSGNGTHSIPQDWYVVDTTSDSGDSKFLSVDYNTLYNLSDLSDISEVGIYLTLNSGISNNYGVRKLSFTGFTATEIPEPSTYALILGCCSLFFVIYIRRKY